MSMQLILVIGVSGAGKNVALGALEDMGFAIVNNLPCALLRDTVAALASTRAERCAVSVDARASDFVDSFNAAYAELQQRYADSLSVIRLDASDTTLMRRFAETRRKHPFASDRNTLQDAIHEERARLRAVTASAFDIDTSATSSHMLRQRVRNLANGNRGDDAAQQPLLEISSFAYRQGIPPDADLVFDVRVLPNPHYEPGLAVQTGRDPAVIAYLEAQPETAALVGAIAAYVRHCLPGFRADNRARVHVAIGCTGGKHRSVYVANALAAALASAARVLRHDREHPKAD